MNEHRKYIIRVRISAYVYTPGSRSHTVRAAAIAHFFHRQFFIKLNSTTRQLQLRNTVLYLPLNAASVAFILQCYSAWISVITFQAGKKNIVLQSIKKLHTPIHSFYLLKSSVSCQTHVGTFSKWWIKSTILHC